MSAEAAFLETLKANPADDTVRLVYADWLDERAEPAKADYLRLVVRLAAMSPVVNPAFWFSPVVLAALQKHRGRRATLKPGCQLRSQARPTPSPHRI